MVKFGTMILRRGIGLLGLAIFFLGFTGIVGRSYASITSTDTLPPPSSSSPPGLPYYFISPGPLTVNEDNSMTLNFASTNVEGHPMTYILQAAHGTVSGSGTVWTYVPNTNFFGVDVLSVTVSVHYNNLIAKLFDAVPIVVKPEPDPPTASFVIPAALSFPGFTNAVVIAGACDAPAQLTLDGSSSSDPDHDSLSYAWFDETNFLGSGVTNAATLDVGVHAATLFVTDGMFTNSASVTFEVISPFTALANLQRILKRANLPKKLDRRLQPMLVNAFNELGNGRIRNARNQLRDFQIKVASRVDPLDSEPGAQLETLSQDIVGSLRDSGSNKAERR